MGFGKFFFLFLCLFHHFYGYCYPTTYFLLGLFGFLFYSTLSNMLSGFLPFSIHGWTCCFWLCPSAIKRGYFFFSYAPCNLMWLTIQLFITFFNQYRLIVDWFPFCLLTCTFSTAKFSCIRMAGTHTRCAAIYCPGPVLQFHMVFSSPCQP